MDDLSTRPAQRLCSLGAAGPVGYATWSATRLAGRTAAPATPVGHITQPAIRTWQRGPHAECVAGSPEPNEGFEGPGDNTESMSAAKQASRWLACSYKSGQLGVAAYDRLSNELSVLQVPDDSKGPCAFQMLQYAKLQVDPQVIVMSATAEAALLTAARAPAATATGVAALDGASQGGSEVLVQLQRPSVFRYEKAMKMLSALVVRATAGEGQQQHPFVYSQQSDIAGLIDLEAQQQVAALGALVAVLLQLQDADGIDGEGVLQVDKLTQMTLEGHLLVDGPSLAALDVFKEEEHPSSMGIGTSKEGVSIYGLLQRCVTGMGKRLLRQWFLRPVVKLDTLTDRHETLDLLVAAPSTNDALRAAMKKVPDLPRLLSRLRLSQAQPQLTTFKQLQDCINRLLQLRQMFEALAPAAAAAAKAPASISSSGPGQLGTASSRHQDNMRQGMLPSWLGFKGPKDDFDRLLGGTAVHYPSGGTGAAAAMQQPAEGPWDKFFITTKLMDSIGAPLAECGALISDVLDFSSPLEGCLVQPGVCDALDELKATHQQLPDLLTQIVEGELRRVPAHVARRYSKQLWSVVYIPQVGFVMCVTGGFLSEELLEYMPDYSLAFTGEDGPAGSATAGGPSDSTADAAAVPVGISAQLSSSCAYYYGDCTRQLNSVYGDLQHKIQDLESSICTELIKRLLDFSPSLSAAAAAVAELDCLCSLAAAARELGYTRPILTRDNVLVIKGGRHPLVELLAPGTFIPNNTHLGLQPIANTTDHCSPQQPGQHGNGAETAEAIACPRMLLITGPNASGKSVYMKQVALLVYLAHVGSFIPADYAVIGLTDRILTHLPGMEAVGQHTSSFMADLGQVSTILKRATSRSLVLLDEFGKGTLTTDGVGLLAALLQHYTSQPTPPFLLACTHFSELLDSSIMPSHPQMQLCTMQVLITSASGQRAQAEQEQGTGAAETGAAHAGSGADGCSAQQEDHVFLYKLVKGHVASSYGLHCARMCGVDDAILMRAADVLQLQQAGHAVSRLQLPQLQQRDEQYWQLIQCLAGLDIADEVAVMQVLQRVAAVEAV